MLAERPNTRRLFFAALARSFTCRGPASYPSALPDIEWLRDNARNPVVAYFFEHSMDFKPRSSSWVESCLIFTYAGLVGIRAEILSCQMYLPMPPAFTTW
jgi:hypothetical protein